MPLLGAHLSISGGYYRAVEAAAELTMETVQIFTASPQIWAVKPAASGDGWQSKPLDTDEVLQFSESLGRCHVTRPVAHSSYLINLASGNEVLWRRSVEAMVVELERAQQLGLFGVVLHPGAATDSTEDEAIARVVLALDDIHERIPAKGPSILLENTAGQGSCLGWRFEQLAAMIAGVRQPKRLGVCLDTCHAFAAGYALEKKSDVQRTLDEFDRVVGIERLRALHLNDSKRELGSRVDRHEHIGHGQIGLEAFRQILRDERLQDLPMYLETPKGKCGDEEWDTVNLRTLRELARATKKRKRS